MNKTTYLSGIIFFFFINYYNAQERDLEIQETPFTIFELQSGCNVFKHSSGSMIIVPENAFHCNNKVVLKYREFRDPYDMVAHDIPMHYKSNNNIYQLESGGMFELRAECEGKEIDLLPNKHIQIRYHCDKHLDNLSVYRLDESDNSWLKYSSEILEMSFNSNENSSTRSDLWGNEAPLDSVLQVDASGEPIFNDFEQPLYVLRSQHPYIKGIFKGMNISKLGIYNYDVIINEAGVIPVIAKAQVSGKEDLSIKKLIIIYDNLNTVYYYFPSDFNENFVVWPNTSAHAFVILENGYIATFPENKFKSVKWSEYKNKTYNFIMDYNSIKPIKKEDLK